MIEFVNSTYYSTSSPTVWVVLLPKLGPIENKNQPELGRSQLPGYVPDSEHLSPPYHRWISCGVPSVFVSISIKRLSIPLASRVYKFTRAVEGK